MSICYRCLNKLKYNTCLACCEKYIGVLNVFIEHSYINNEPTPMSYYENNKQMIKERTKKWLESKGDAYMEEFKERRRKNSARFYEMNKEKVAAMQKRYRDRKNENM